MGHCRTCFALAVVITVAGEFTVQSSLPCNFDSNFCEWTQDRTDVFDWTRNHGSTNSTNTGPSADHTSGNGYYAYIETSSPRKQNDTARLLSPWIYGSAKCLTFWYMMWGTTLGNLNVYTRSRPFQPLGTPVFTRSGPSSRSWKKAFLNLSGDTARLQVVIEATRGSSYLGDIAIDDISSSNGNCTEVEPEIRLVNGRNALEGRVEVYLNEQWGTVCDDSWDNNDAEVVCRQLGLNTTFAMAFSHARFGQGSGSILMDEVRCRGSESRLTDCSVNPVGDNDCSHSEDAGVSCYPAVSKVKPAIRLVNGRNALEGRVEVYLNGQWDTVCDDSWDNNDAEVVCRQLGLNTTFARAFSQAHFGQGSGSILMYEVRCRGSESRLTDCTVNPVGDNCGHSEDAGVSCYPAATIKVIRLVNGEQPGEGRVEVYLNGQWGTVCDDDWDNDDAEVVCRQLGLNTNSAVAHSRARFGQGSGSILLNNVHCTGSENHLTDCNATRFGINNCRHSEDAGVFCTSRGWPIAQTCVEQHTLSAWQYQQKYLYSPNYPLNYPSSYFCKWTISAPYNNYVSLYVVVMNLECGFDTLFVFDGASQYSLLGSLCGSSDQETTLTSTGRYMTVVFRSDASTNRRGFKVRYTAVTSSTTFTLPPSNEESYSSYHRYSNTGLIVGLSVAGCVFLVLVVVIVARYRRFNANQRRPAGQVIGLPPASRPYAPGPSAPWLPAAGASVYSTPGSGGVTSPAYAYGAPPPAYDSLDHGTPGVTSDYASLNPGHARTAQVFDNPAFSAGNPSHYDNPPCSAGNPSHPDNPDRGQAGATSPASHPVSDAGPTVVVPPDSSACLPAYTPHMALTHPPSDFSPK